MKLAAAQKRALLPELQKHWSGLQPQHQQLAAAGAAIAASGLAHRATRSTDDESFDWLTPALTLGGAGLGAYGLSGGDWRNALPALQKITGYGQAAQSSPATTGAATGLSRFLNQDGSVRIHDVVKAPDEELAATAKSLDPAARARFGRQIESFRPTAWQSMGAKALGIDVEAQRRRLAGLLA